MKHEFWHDKWQSNNIGFHLSNPNPLLIKHIHSLNLQPQARIFIPLCGKSLDIHWLLQQEFHVTGIDLSPIAIEELISELKLEFTVSQVGGLTHYHHHNIDLYVGDFFELSLSHIFKIDATYDRAALVALPEHMREAYTRHLVQLTQNAPQLLISFEYDQDLLAGPPFSVPEQELRKYYSSRYKIKQLASEYEKLKGKVDAKENVWLLEKISTSH
ncbi:thiopurine S-methyltransferase [Acinetobacter venetianus]|uniref:Thiopurine S-methyltransferase n=1 Tax=Acinetobacter venetianus TaxID=52133 RepID=A0A150I0B7_9GAMM|nr:thiopurine S-methyltransferase [Acinetobacter venetianus]KXZ72985.1 Thiopurine S-methyltransferase [Acinetobacter venetianus]